MAKGTPGRQVCSVETCSELTHGRGWCSTHYARWEHTGDVQAGRPIRKPWTVDTFWAATTPNGACLDWNGPIQRRNGREFYGRLRWEGQLEGAHRVAFFLRLGRWPDPELELRHLCNRPICVLHAVEGTRSENVLDSVKAGTHNNASKTHCKYGHKLTPENTYTPPSGGRECIVCRRRRADERQQRKRGSR